MVEETNPEHGGRTILVTLRFSTDGIAEKEGHIIPGFCNEMGFVNIPKEGNEEHYLKPLGTPVPFGTLDDLPAAVAEALYRADAAVLRGKNSPPKK